MYSRGVGFEVAVTEVEEGAGVAGPGHFSGRGRYSNQCIFQSRGPGPGLAKARHVMLRKSALSNANVAKFPLINSCMYVYSFSKNKFMYVFSVNFQIHKKISLIRIFKGPRKFQLT